MVHIKDVKTNSKLITSETDPDGSRLREANRVPQDMLVHFLHTITALGRVPGVQGCPKFSKFQLQIMKTDMLTRLLEQVQGS